MEWSESSATQALRNGKVKIPCEFRMPILTETWYSCDVTRVEFRDGSNLVSCKKGGSTKRWDVASGKCKEAVPKFAFSKAVAGTEQRAGRFLIT